MKNMKTYKKKVNNVGKSRRSNNGIGNLHTMGEDTTGTEFMSDGERGWSPSDYGYEHRYGSEGQLAEHLAKLAAEEAAYEKEFNRVIDIVDNLNASDLNHNASGEAMAYAQDALYDMIEQMDYEELKELTMEDILAEYNAYAQE